MNHEIEPTDEASPIHEDDAAPDATKPAARINLLPLPRSLSGAGIAAKARWPKGYDPDAEQPHLQMADRRSGNIGFSLLRTTAAIGPPLLRYPRSNGLSVASTQKALEGSLGCRGRETQQKLSNIAQ